MRIAACGAVASMMPVSFSAWGEPTKYVNRGGRMTMRFFPYELQLRHAFNLAKYQRTTTPDVQVEIEYDGVVGYGEASMPPYLGGERRVGYGILVEARPEPVSVAFRNGGNT